jgi:hypothetical protein
MVAPAARSSLFVAALAIALGAAVGCKPSVGDSCKLSTDCSVTGDRLCDTSMPDGYCTIFNCNPNNCPDEAVCVEFHQGQPRFSRRFCLKQCGSPSDCRSGYVCIDPQQRDGKIVDDNPNHSTVCLP